MSDASWTWMVYLATHNNAAEVGQASLTLMRRTALNAGFAAILLKPFPDANLIDALGGDPVAK